MIQLSTAAFSVLVGLVAILGTGAAVAVAWGRYQQRIAQHEREQDELKQLVRELKGDVAVLREEVGVLREIVAVLRDRDQTGRHRPIRPRDPA